MCIYIDPKTLSGITPKWLKHGTKPIIKKKPVLYRCSRCEGMFTYSVWSKHFSKCFRGL